MLCSTRGFLQVEIHFTVNAYWGASSRRCRTTVTASALPGASNSNCEPYICTHTSKKLRVYSTKLQKFVMTVAQVTLITS